MRQPGADHDQRRARLRQLVARRAQRRDVVRRHVLHLVDQQRDARADVLRQLRDLGEQLHQVDLDVTGVRPADRRGHVDARLPPVAQLRVLGVGPQRERLQHAEHGLHPVGRAVPHGQVADRPVQRGRQRAAQPGLGPCLDLPGAPAALHRHRPQLAQQHGLAHAAQPGEHEAAFRPAARHPFEHDLERAELLVAPASSGGRWPAPGANGLRTGSILGRYRGVYGRSNTRAVSAGIRNLGLDAI